jgi:hypothetical protein
MGQAAGIAGAASIASLGLTVASSLTEGKATQAADEFKAAHAERAAEIGRTQAELTDTVMRENLSTTLANIDVIRAAGHADPTSPTTAAVEDYNRKISERQRLAAVGTQEAQADEDAASARYLRQAGEFAVTQSYLKAFTQVAGGTAQAFGPKGSLSQFG